MATNVKYLRAPRDHLAENSNCGNSNRLSDRTDEVQGRSVAASHFARGEIRRGD
jgi:hypothetical protein